MGILIGMRQEDAWRIGAGIRDALLRDGKRANIAVVSRDGALMFLFQMDRTRPFTANVALQKALQAASTGRRTRYLNEQVDVGALTPQVLGYEPDEFIRWPGGVPVYQQVGDELVLIGGAGVSELTGDEDEAYCIKGVRRAGFISAREGDEPLPENPESIRFAHHVGICFTNRVTVEAFVAQLVQRGAVVVSENSEGGKYFLQLNPGDTVLLEVFHLEGDRVGIHVDYAVLTLDSLTEVHGDGVKDVGVSNMLFLLLDIVGVEEVSTSLAFSIRK